MISYMEHIRRNGYVLHNVCSAASMLRHICIEKRGSSGVLIERSKLGELIFFCRNIQKESQYDLCSGLCSVSTLTRK